MTFCIAGTGNIAWFLATRLVDAGHTCTGIYGRDIDNAQELAGKVSAPRYGLISDIKDGEADICFLAVSDTAIDAVAATLSLHDTTLVHTAGAVAIDGIAAYAQHCGVLWPVYSIVRSNLPMHRDIPCAWEASSAQARQYIQQAGNAITDTFFEAKYEQRKWLHVSAVFSNNFTTHLLAICEQICTENQLPFDVLQPIIQQTFQRLQQVSPLHSQTGPAIRRDTATIDRHMQLLSNHPHWQEVYKAITSSIQSFAANAQDKRE